MNYVQKLLAPAAAVFALSCAPTEESVRATITAGGCLKTRDEIAYVVSPNAVLLTDRNVMQFAQQPGTNIVVMSELLCGPCHGLMHFLKQLSEEHPGAFKLGEFSLDACSKGNLAKLGAGEQNSAPITVILKDGVKIGVVAGFEPGEIQRRLGFIK